MSDHRPAAYAAALAAHRELWARFVDPQFGVLYDFAGLDGEISLPTAAELAELRPNALAWGAPNENGAFFGGLYLDALCRRWLVRPDDRAAGEAYAVAAGLLRLATCGATPGFIARGLALDGVAHPAAGSDDQTYPWFYGLWRFCHSPLCDTAWRARVLPVVLDVAEALEARGWRLPCDRPELGHRGDFDERTGRQAARRLFVLRAVADLSGEARWFDRYRAELPGWLELCAAGLSWREPGVPHGYPENPHFWITSSSQAGLRALWEMEDDPAVKAAYAQGLATNAAVAALHIACGEAYDAAATQPFELDWRRLNEFWRPQPDLPTALAVAERQIGEAHRHSPRRHFENETMREPLFAAWAVALAAPVGVPDGALAACWQAVTRYPWEQFYQSTFFIATNIVWQLAADELA